ncbi:MAG: tripartite tricarboxylate transporter substrate-binding protein [Paracoccus sp. (in: a-proteobacteria)]|uniref:Bug family tripartite tricarboxylate transporter substrate binding protein n=1 Tax=Paracoccus sp. TaxID=267 RepID=UPI0026DEA366|nr:tripartite tricarboxylate transporter substrate-binding protein [Paracoccus sp. (in: a-proteobacteria)]MDO5633171.1 tripartite tricarboxylate transporter substrate-binding protein [Paracoccus sp. (in: a-proteobacteria)]
MKKTLRTTALTFMLMTVPAMATECIAPATPGGGWDFTCRQIGRIMTELGLVPDAVQVTNLAGAGGGVAYAQLVGKRDSDPDLFVAASAATTTRLAQNAYAGATADQVRWVGSIGGDPGVIVVAANSRYQNLTDLIEAVKADPSRVTFAGSSAVGGFDHLKVLIMLDKAGFHDPRAVKYISLVGGGDAITQTIGGFAQAMTGDMSEVAGFIASGELRPLAVLSAERIATYPDVPTAREQGVDMVAMNWRGIYVPQNISDQDYAEWVSRMQAVADSDQWKTVMAENGLEPYTLLGEAFQEFLAENIAEIQAASRGIGIVQ